VPKAGWVRFRWSRPVPEGVKSYRVNLDPASWWHVAFAAVPEPVPGPGTGEVVGVDRGVAVTLALSDGTAYQAPVARPVARLQRKLSRAKRGSNRRKRIRAQLARVQARNTDACKDWAEKASTGIARRYDLIRVEDAARNIAVGHAVTARGGLALAGPVNREPQHALLAS
jgi:putative transposase